MQRYARARRVVQSQRPVLCFDAVEIDHLAVEERADVAGFVERMDEALKHKMRSVVAHRGGERAECQAGEFGSDDQSPASWFTRQITLRNKPIDQAIGGRLR